MKRTCCLLLLSLLVVTLCAQSADPVVMKVGPNSVTRSEFQYFYRNNYSEDTPVKGDNLMYYANLYSDFKLKVQAAVDAGIDTTASFLQEFREYRGIQAEGFLLDSTYLENFARMTFQRSRDEVGEDGIRMFGIISIRPADNNPADKRAAVQLVDSLWNRLGEGDDFRELAAKHSQDGMARNGGVAGWYNRTELPDVLAANVFSIETGKYSRPFEFEDSYVIVKVFDVQKFDRFEDHRDAIYEWMKSQEDIYPESKLKKAEQLSEQYDWNLSPEEALLREDSLLEELYPEFANISREYHDGLLLFEICNREIWEKAAADTLGKLEFFNANRKNYTFETPVFKGMLFCCTDNAVFDEVKEMLKDVPFDEWTDRVVKYNSGGVKVRVMRGPLEKGQSKMADAVIFGEDIAYEQVKGYPYVDFIGHVITVAEEPDDVAVRLVNDYQDKLEADWMRKLKKKYRTKYYKKALKTVTLED